MENIQISRILSEIAFWLVIAGESPFAVRAYSSAATTVKRSGTAMTTLLQENKLGDLRGIGPALKECITECITTGRSKQLDEFRNQFPSSLHSLLRVPGLGAKTIRLLYESLKVKTLPDVKAAAVNGTLAAVQGFSRKKIECLLGSIAFAEEQEGKFRLPPTMNAAETVLSFLKTLPEVGQCDLTGLLRRACTIHEVFHVLVLTSDEQAVVAALEEEYEASSDSFQESPSLFTSKEGIPFQVSFTSAAEAWVPLLMETTGSEEHLAEVKRRLDKKGLIWPLNTVDYSASDLSGFEDETALYNAIDLPFYPPETREDFFFSSDTISHLIKQEDLQGLVHCHTTWSDGAHSLKEMALASQSHGYKYMLVTDHSQSSVVANGLFPDTVQGQHEEIDQLNKELEDIRILKGIEADILKDGSLDYEEDTLRSFDWIIASIHNGLDMSSEEATARLIQAIENPYTCAVGHPSGRQLLLRPGYDFDQEKIFDAAVANQVALEINASPKRLDLDWQLLRQAADKGVRFIISPDAHRMAGLQNVHYGVLMARKSGLASEHVLNCRSVKEFLQWRKK